MSEIVHGSIPGSAALNFVIDTLKNDRVYPEQISG